MILTLTLISNEVKDNTGISQARAAYRQFISDHYHPSLQFKPVDRRKILYSVRIGLHYRALGVRAGKDVIMWDWIGSHAEYDNLLKKR